MDKTKIFLLEISHPTSNHTAEIALPATAYELLDAFEKIHITNQQDMSMEILNCELDYLPQFINFGTSIDELNHLAGRLSSMSQWELDCFEGMTMMDAIQTQYAPIAIDRLINMTHSMSDCHVVYEAHDDASLGKFYADNSFVPELETLSGRIFPWLDYAKIGKEMREGEGGVFTPNGYVVQNSPIAEIYQSGDAVPTEKPDYAVLLLVEKAQEQVVAGEMVQVNKSLLLSLPATDEAIRQAVEAVGADSLIECTLQALDCMVPQLSALIAEELQDCESDIAVINSLAEQLHEMSDSELRTYKAMLEAAPDDISLEDALDLAGQTEKFSLITEAISPADYAKIELHRMMSHEGDAGLARFCNLDGYGRFLMEKDGVMQTSYGLLEQQSEQTLAECLNRSDPSHSMEMK